MQKENKNEVGGRIERIQEDSLKRHIERQSNHIERFFSQRNLSAEVSGGIVDHNSVRFNLKSHMETNLSRLKQFTTEVGQALGISDVEMDRKDGFISLRLPRTKSPEVSLYGVLSLVPSLPALTAVLGLSEDGNPVLLDFSDEDVSHVLLAGDKNSGKSSMLRTISLSLALTNKQSQIQLVVFNPQSGEDSAYTILEPLSYLPHVIFPTIYDSQEGTESLSFLSNELDYRNEQGIKHPGIVVMVDEFINLIQEGGDLVESLLLKLLQDGAACGIHLVLSTMRYDATDVNEALKASIPIKIIGRIGSRQDANTICGEYGNQAEHLDGHGDFFAIVNNSEPLHFQGAFVNDEDLFSAVDELQRNRPRPILAMPSSTRDYSHDFDANEKSGQDIKEFIIDEQGVHLDDSDDKSAEMNPDLSKIEGVEA